MKPPRGFVKTEFVRKRSDGARTRKQPGKTRAEKTARGCEVTGASSRGADA